MVNKETTSELLKTNGFVVYKNIIPKEKTSAAAKLSQELYLNEHFKAISSKELPESFTVNNPFPKTDKREMLNFMESSGSLNLPTLHGSMSVKARLSKEFLDILNDQATIDLLSQLLNSEKVFLHLCPAVRVLHPNFNFALVMYILS